MEVSKSNVSFPSKENTPEQDLIDQITQAKRRRISDIENEILNLKFNIEDIRAEILQLQKQKKQSVSVFIKSINYYFVFINESKCMGAKCRIFWFFQGFCIGDNSHHYFF